MTSYNMKPEVKSEYWDSVMTLANKMDEKLSKNAHKGRWEDVNPLWAFKRLIDEASELLEAVLQGFDQDEVWKEAADVANFALIIAEANQRKLEDEGDNVNG